MVLFIAFIASAGARTGKGTQIFLLDGWGRRSSGTTGTTANFVRGSHCSVQRGEVAHHTVVQLLLIRVDGLGMLAQVVEARELF